MQIVARRYDDRQAVSVEIEDSTITRIEPHQGGDIDSMPWIAPGFVDVQVNGYGGDDFADPSLTVEKVIAISTRLDPGGVTSYCPTATTHSNEVLSHAMQTIAAAREASPEVACRVPCIHLEGPYISPEDGPRGAHPKQHVRQPDWDEFQRLQEAAGGLIGILTLSPHWDNSPEVISKVAASGVVVAIGHTHANSDQIKAAVDAGATMSTHLGNGAHPRIRRHPNYIWDQLADDRLTASIITDGHHLPGSVMKSFVRGKTIENCIVVSDVTGMAGMKPGLYHTSLGDIEMLEDGRLVVAGQRDILAGASLPISYCVANLMRHAELDLKTAVEMASTKPAKIIGQTPGRIEAGAAANLTLFDLPEGEGNIPLNIRATINGGRVVYGSVE